MARAIMKLPMKRKIIGLAKELKTFFSSSTPKMMQRAAPKRALTGIGSASVIQKMITRLTIASKRCAGPVRPVKGISRIVKKTSGPKKRPTVLRHLSKTASPAEIFSSISKSYLGVKSFLKKGGAKTVVATTMKITTA